MGVALTEMAEPIGERGGLAEAGWSGHQGQAVVRSKAGVEPLEDAWARNQVRAPGGANNLVASTGVDTTLGS